MTTTEDIHTFTGAYVLDAISDVERRAFENHLTGCASCAQEVTELLETAARLGQETVIKPPPALWEAVRDASSTTRQLPPVPVTSARPARHRAPRRWSVRIAIGMVAASVLAAVTLGATLANRETELEGQLAQSHSQLDKITGILGAPDARVAHRAESDGRTATMVLSHQANAMMLMAQGLPALSPDQSFQAWFATDDGRKISIGLLTASHGTLVADLPADTETSFVALTVEPRGGSATPSDNVVLAVPAGT
jgi:anti-sigma-K factor RskA